MEPEVKCRQLRGFLCALVNALGGAVTGLLAKLSSIFNPFVLLMWSTGSVFLYLSAIVTKKELKKLFTVKTCSERLAVLACVVCVPVCSICGYLSIVYMEFADSFAIQQSNVIICSLLAWVLLKEALFWIDWICLLSTMTGILLIARPGFIFGSQFEGSVEYTERWKGIVLALAGATLSSLFGVGRRKIVGVDNLTLAFFQTGFGFPIHTVLALTIHLDNMAPILACGTRLEKFYLAFSGLLHGVCVLCNFVLFRYLPAVYAMTLKAMSSVFSYILQISFSLEPISWLSLVGSMLIVASVIAKVVWVRCTKDSSKSDDTEPTQEMSTIEYTF